MFGPPIVASGEVATGVATATGAAAAAGAPAPTPRSAYACPSDASIRPAPVLAALVALGAAAAAPAASAAKILGAITDAANPNDGLVTRPIKCEKNPPPLEED